MEQLKSRFPFLAHNCEIKASSLKAFPSLKEDVLATIVEQSVSISYIVADQSRVEEALFNDKRALYDYLAVRLLDRVITQECQGEKINITCDSMPPGNAENCGNSFANYITIHFNLECRYDLDLSIMFKDSSNEDAYAVQAADYVANAIYQHYVAGNDRFMKCIEHRLGIVEAFPNGDATYY
jgi:hypothetical protein